MITEGRGIVDRHKSGEMNDGEKLLLLLLIVTTFYGAIPRTHRDHCSMKAYTRPFAMFNSFTVCQIAGAERLRAAQ